MKKLHVWSLLLITFCFMHTGYAQEELTREICDEKAEEILKFRHHLKDYPHEVLNEMIEFIAPCSEDNYSRTSPKSAYARALIHYQKGDFAILYGHNKELSEFYFFRSAVNNYPPGMFRHGIYKLSNSFIVKDGSVHYLDIYNDFKRLLTLGYETDVVNYVLGYLSLKNLHTWRVEFTTETLVNEAKTYFENSNHPMAKHWLAIIHYFGYGVPEDKAKGLQMLSENDILNSQTLLQHLQGQNNDWIPISAEERRATVEIFYYLDVPELETLDDQVYHGHFIEYDWLDRGVAKRYIPVSLSLEYREAIGTYTGVNYELTIEGQTISGNGVMMANNGQVYISFYPSFPLVLPPLENLLQDHPDKNTITYSSGIINFRTETIDGKSALIARLGHKIVDYNEDIRKPVAMILYPEEAAPLLAQNEPRIATETPLDKNFAVISPNPIGDQFTITYTLDQAATVEVAIYDFFGQQRVQVPTQKSSAGATQTITVDSTTLISGTYIVQMTINGQPYSKTVIKL